MGGADNLLQLPDGPGVHAVVPNNTAADNCILLCKDNKCVLTCAELLAMLSPVVLADLVRLARAACHSDIGSTSGSPACSTAVSRRAPVPHIGTDGAVIGRLELPVRDDCAEAWLNALRLVHPGLMPSERPQLTWDQAKAVTTLADKYAMTTIKALGDQKLSEAMASGEAGVIVAGLEMVLQALEFSVALDLPRLNMCCCVAVGAMFQAFDYSPADGVRISALLKRLRQLMQSRPCKSLESHVLMVMMDVYEIALNHAIEAGKHGKINKA